MEGSTSTKVRPSRRLTVSMSSTTLARSESSCFLYCSHQTQRPLIPPSDDGDRRIRQPSCACQSLGQSNRVLGLSLQLCPHAGRHGVGGAEERTMSKMALSLILSYVSSLCFAWMSCRRRGDNTCEWLRWNFSQRSVSQASNGSRTSSCGQGQTMPHTASDSPGCSGWVRTPIFLLSVSQPLSVLRSTPSIACSTSPAVTSETGGYGWRPPPVYNMCPQRTHQGSHASCCMSRLGAARKSCQHHGFSIGIMQGFLPMTTEKSPRSCVSAMFERKLFTSPDVCSW